MPPESTASADALTRRPLGSPPPGSVSVVVQESPDAPWRWGILIGAALVVLGVGVRATSGVIAPVFLALNMVVTAYPLEGWLRRKRLPGWFATITTLVVVYAMLFAILGAVVYAAAKLAATIPDYSSKFQELYDSGINRLAKLGVEEEQLREIFGKIDVNNFTGVAKSLVSTLSGGLSLLLLLVTLLIFVGSDASSTQSRIAWIARDRPPIAAGLRDFGTNVRKYWIVSTIFGLIVALVDVVALWIIGVPLALTWGVLAFVTNYIPNIGFVLGLIPPAFLALLDGGLGTMLAVIITYAVINFVIQTIIQPRFTGDAVGINGTTAFVSLIFWAYVLGPLGALLAIPATLFLKSLLLDHTPGAQWVSALISSSSAPNPAPLPQPATGTRRHESPY